MTSNSIYVKEFSEKFPNIDLSEYFQFIEKYRLKKKQKFISEDHHILPKWAFPEFENFLIAPWNKAILNTADHIKAHLLLLRHWAHNNNMHPIRFMLPKIKNIANLHEITEDYINEMVLAKEMHARNTSEFFSGYKFSEEHSMNVSKARLKYFESLEEPMMNAISIETGKSCYITCSEYHKFKNVKYISHSTGKLPWNFGISNEKAKNKLSVYLKDTRERVYISTEEFWANKHLYVHPSEGKEIQKLQGMTPIIVIATGERKSISSEEYEQNKHLYRHPTSNKIWINNGKEAIRIPKDDPIPEGFVRGRGKVKY